MTAQATGVHRAEQGVSQLAASPPAGCGSLCPDRPLGPCACPSEGAEAVLVVDAQQPRPAGPRQPVDVAVGLLIDAQGRFLMTTRPPGKAYAGYWEFPGGKVEAGETVQQALQRELREEIGIEIGAAQPWQTLVVDYPHALVRLHVCRITRWQGELRMHEGQDCAWQTLPVTVAPVLPGTVPLLQALGQAA